jgi:molybdenum cofactor cytidylyltransferase
VIVGAVVLAAGRSARMGSPKPLLPCGGTSFLGAILRSLACSHVTAVRVVLGHAAADVRSAAALPDDLAVVNPAWETGMLSSVQCGLRALPPECEAFVLWPVDHPLATPSTVDRLIDLHVATRASVVIPVHEGRRGHPVLFSSSLRGELMSAPEALGARAVVRAHAHRLLEAVVDDPGVVADVDTPEDYERFLGRPGGPAGSRT